MLIERLSLRGHGERLLAGVFVRQKNPQKYHPIHYIIYLYQKFPIYQQPFSERIA
jgi:hypothetical protein